MLFNKLLIITAIFFLFLSFAPLSFADTANHLVISEVQIRGSVADDEFVEIYNPTANPINLSTLPLKLHIINSSGTDQNKALTFISNIIPAYGYFLIGPATGYAGSVTLDATYAATGNKLVDNGAVYISTATSTDKTGLIDLVGFGTAITINREGSAIANPAALRSIERKAFVGVEEMYGNGEDTNDNNADFIIKSTPVPQNTSSARESLNWSFEIDKLGYPLNWWKRLQASLDTGTGHTGSSLKIMGSNNTSAVYSFQNLLLKPNTTYTLSGWVKTQNVTGKGISFRYAQLQPQTRVFDTAYWLNGTSDWKEVKIIFTTPVDYVSGRLDILWELQNGDLAWVDDLSIKETPGASMPVSNINALVDNPSFESYYISNSILYPNRWKDRTTSSWDSISRSGSGSIKLIGPISGQSFVYSFQEIILEPNSTYTLSAWVKTAGVVGRGIGVRYAQLQPITKIFQTPFVTGTVDWTQISTTFTTSSNYKSGRLDVIWNLQSGDTGWIDDLSLVKQ